MRRLFLALTVLLATAAAGWWWLGMPSLIAPVPSPGVAVASPDLGPVVTAHLSASDRAWASAFRAVLAPAAATSGELVRLGDEKSRNLFAIRNGQARMGDALTAADTFLATSPAPAGLAGVAADYRAGAALVRQAMAEAMAGFVRFDWGRVKAATGEMRAGQASLARALAALDASASATPGA